MLSNVMNTHYITFECGLYILKYMGLHVQNMLTIGEGENVDAYVKIECYLIFKTY